MQTKAQTTYILLERGVEDKALWYELNSIIAALKIKSIAEFIVRYPTLNELKYNLKGELDSQEILFGKH